MSITVRQLNADSTFLLILSHKTHPLPDDLTKRGGAFTVLIDPWLTGRSIVNAKWFAMTERRLPGAIKHLSELEEPDVVLISQNKPDHCHRETLLQLRPDAKTLIAAEPGASRVIKSWHHFDTARVHALQKYDPTRASAGMLKLPIPALSMDGIDGELCIAFLPARNYVTGLHNAFGITFTPPAPASALSSFPSINMPVFHNVRLTEAPQTCRKKLSQPVLLPRRQPVDAFGWSTTKSYAQLTEGSEQNLHERPVLPDLPDLSDIELSGWCQMATDPFDSTDTNDRPTSTPSLTSLSNSPSTLSHPSSTALTPRSTILSTPPSIAKSPSTRFQQILSPMSNEKPRRPKALSVLYSPHGVPIRDLEPYIRNHLLFLPGALPLTCLLHSFDYAANPWWFGGNIMMGVEGGLDIARTLMARCWISAHDEVKTDQGIAVKLLKCDRTPADVVKQRIQLDPTPWSCDVYNLEVGKHVTLNSMEGSLVDDSIPAGLGVDLGIIEDPLPELAVAVQR